MKLVKPQRCTSALPLDFEKEHLVAEEKLDGSRYVLYIGGDPYERSKLPNTMLSRRVSTVDGKHVDRTENLPHITEQHYEGLEGTILDGEVQAADFLATNSIMNSGPRLAIQKQNEVGYCVYHVFDIMFFRGKDLRGMPLEKRRKVLEEVVHRMGNEFIRCIPQVHGGIESYFTEIVSRGGEGLIIKDLRQGYGMGWAKMKKVYDVSCIVSGYKNGNGKYNSQIGSLALSVYHDGELIEVGFASGFDDSLRREMSDNFERFYGRVVDVYAQEIQNSKRSSSNSVGRLRHPTFIRFRDDISPKTVTSKKLWDDLKAAKTRRGRIK